MPHDTDGPICKCGCGEGLPKGSPRQFKRGHAKLYNQRLAAEIAKGNPNPEEGAIAPPPMDDAFEGLSTSWDGIKNPFENMADQFPDDPNPDESARDQKAATVTPINPNVTVVTKQVAQDVQGKLAFLLSMPTAMLMPLDPICFGTVQENIPQVTAALVPLICQSPDMVKFFTKGSGFILWLNLGVAMWPVIQVVIAHHLTKSIGQGENGQPKAKDYSQYAA
jgi:hypothetical protein